MIVINLREQPAYLAQAIAYFQAKWAGPETMQMYEDSIRHSFSETLFPQWFLWVDDTEKTARQKTIVGCADLIPNNFISRKDLTPWLRALYVDPTVRKQGGGRLLIQAVQQAARTGGYRH
ncbi:GNAT family N-acetyltransferase [Enterococcus sp. DIV0876]|uniref:GNAT family N-acetyltransferase n=1 Tax=Enterococcus sp. DIV0876 TaxID=2774633 RepID=UPI003D2F9FAD